MSRTLLEAANLNDRLLLEKALNSQYGRLSASDIEGALLRAACHGYAACVSRLLDEGIDIDCVDMDGDTPLMLATSNYMTDVVRLLIDGGCDVNMQSDRERTALHMAVWNNCGDIVRMLLQAGCDVNIQEMYGDTAMMLCARQGYADLLILLLDAGSDVDTRGEDKDTALHYAARYGHVDCVRILMDYSPDMEAMTIWRHTPLLHAVTFRYPKAAEALIEYGADVFVEDGSNKKTLLHYAAKHGMRDLVNILLNHGLSPDVIDMSGNTPLIEAIEANQVQTAKVLIQRGCNVNVIGHCAIGRQYAWFSPVEIAVQGGRVKMTQLLVRAGCDVSVVNRWAECGEYPLPLQEDRAWLHWLQDAASGTPSLSELCRLAISRQLGSRVESQIEALPLPPSLRDYLAYRDMDLEECP